MAAESDARSKKALELASLAASGCSDIGLRLPDDSARMLVKHFAAIAPPDSELVASSSRVDMDAGGRGGGVSVKPGNVRLNMRQLVSAIASGVLTVVGAVQLPWTAVFGALVIWNNLFAASRVALSESDASVLWTLWLNRDDENTVAEAGLLGRVNEERRRHGRADLAQRDLDESLQRLSRLQSIERAADKSRWWLREWVSVKYN